MDLIISKALALKKAKVAVEILRNWDVTNMSNNKHYFNTLRQQTWSQLFHQVLKTTVDD